MKILPSLLALTLLSQPVWAGNAQSGPCNLPYSDDEDDVASPRNLRERILDDLGLKLTFSLNDDSIKDFEEQWREKGVNGHKGTYEGSIAILTLLKFNRANALMLAMEELKEFALANFFLQRKGDMQTQLDLLRHETYLKNSQDRNQRIDENLLNFLDTLCTSTLAIDRHKPESLKTLVKFYQAYDRKEAALATQILLGVVTKAKNDDDILQFMIEDLGWNVVKNISLENREIPSSEPVQDKVPSPEVGPINPLVEARAQALKSKEEAEATLAKIEAELAAATVTPPQIVEVPATVTEGAVVSALTSQEAPQALA